MYSSYDQNYKLVYFMVVYSHFPGPIWFLHGQMGLNVDMTKNTTESFRFLRVALISNVCSQDVLLFLIDRPDQGKV